MKIKENKTRCYVDVIRSYQTLIGERIINGKFAMRYQKPEYKKYQKELLIGIQKLNSIEKDIPIKVIITFNIKGGIKLPEWFVKMKSTGNTSRKYTNEKEALEYMDDEKHYIEFEDYNIKFGKGDEDNLTKPIYDTLTESGILVDDMYIVDSHKNYTYNNNENSIDIELIKMKVEVTDLGQYIFI